MGWLTEFYGTLLAFNTILYENQFQNPQISRKTLRLFPEQSTLGGAMWGQEGQFGAGLKIHSVFANNFSVFAVNISVYVC
jgi:hypothetical protein